MSVQSVQANAFPGPDARSWRYPPKDALMLVLGFVAIAAVSFAAVLRDNLDENGATIWMRRGGRAERQLTMAVVLARL
jgi:hypothetical protein